MLVKIEKSVNSSYRNIMQKVIFIETEHIESMQAPTIIKMVSGSSHTVSKEDYDLVLNIMKNQSKNKNMARP